jgi:glycosyltransferase involved in cell wall biosynthesis
MTTKRVPDLLVDIQTVQGGFFGNRGIRRYVLGFARALEERACVRALLLNPSRPWHEELPSDLRTAPGIAWSTRRKLRELTEEGAAAYVMTSPFEQASPNESVLPSLVVESGTPIIAVLYDLIPEIVDVYPASLMPGYRARRELLKDADLVLTLSEHVRRDAVRRLGIPMERTAVIGAAASELFRPRGPGEDPGAVLAAQLPRVSRPFVLSVTGWQAHKNVEALIEAWSRVPNDVRRQHQLVLTCPLPPGADTVWNEVAVGFGLAQDDVVVTGRVDDDVVRALYQQAELFVLPSFEEGFGLPVLEAARCGCPAITSSTSSLPEVLEWEPATFPPEDVDRMAESVERGLLDPGFRADLRAVGDAAARRHTWDRVADRTVDACSDMPAGRRPRRHPPLRIALVGRFAPTTTPTATAVDRVMAPLPSTCRVDRFDTAEAGRASAASPSRSERVRTYPLRALGRARDPAGYDAIVYLVDAHPTRELRDLAKAHPGVVWFVEQPRDHLADAELRRDASTIVRAAALPALAVDSGPFGRASRSMAAPEHGDREAEGLLAALGLPASTVTQPSR